MADGDPKPKFRTTPVSGTTRGPTTQATLDKLRSIYIYTDELKKRAEGERARGEGGTVTFVTTSNNKLLATLGKTYFPAGTFEAKIDRRAPKQRPTISSLTAIFPKDLDAEVMKGLQAVLNSPTNVMTWGSKDGAVLKKIERAFDSSAGATVRIVVSYSKAATGNPTTLPNTVPLTDAQGDVLKDPAIARLYLQFVEHFGGLPVDYSLAEGGIDRAELDQIEKGRQPFIDITNLFTQCVGEFLAVKQAAPPPPVGIPELSAMTEQIFNQRKNKNDLARRNLLGIALGHLIFVDDQGAIRSKRDIGVIRKTGGDNAEIIYDRHGAPVRVLGYSDTEFRSVDMKKVARDTGLPTFDITISDPALYAFLRSLEQTLGQPLREMEALAVSLYKHSIFIAESIARNYNGELAKRVIEMLPIVLGFFVAHAIASFLVSRGHPAGVAFMALIKGTGLVLGIDGQLMSFKQMAIAGSHFALMEELHRETSTGKKIELTKLSQAHLDAGARILMDAIVDFIASGVILVGVFLPSRVGPAILKGIKNRAAARSKVTVKDNVATEIEPTNADETVKVPSEKKLEGGESGLETAEGRAAKDKPPEAHNVEQPNAHVAEGQKGSTPALKPFTRKRPRALDQSPDEFANDKAAQQELFEAAGQAVTRQKAFIAEVVKDLGIKDVEVVSVRKRENLADFVHGIIAKIKGRKSYKTVSEMSDIIRGRISVKNPKDVKRVMQEIVARGMLSPGGFKRPSTRSGVKDGYPRWHVDVIEPESGIVHEWQIGTKASNRLYQDTGIDVGVVKIARENRNLHDVEYDIFKAIEEPPVVGRTPEQIAELKALAVEVGIPDFRVRLAKLSARTGNEAIPDSELAQLIKSFHDEAGQILKALVDKKGAAFVESFLH